MFGKRAVVVFLALALLESEGICGFLPIGSRGCVWCLPKRQPKSGAEIVRMRQLPWFAVPIHVTHKGAHLN
jgi:hypothetical protein